MIYYLRLGSTSSGPTEFVRRFSFNICHSGNLISGKLDEFMQSQKEQNLKLYALLLDILFCNRKLELYFFIHAKLLIRNAVKLGTIERSNRPQIPENFIFFIGIKNQHPIRRELFNTIVSHRKGFLYQLQI